MNIRIKYKFIGYTDTHPISGFFSHAGVQNIVTLYLFFFGYPKINKTNERTDLHQFRKEPSYDGDVCPCEV